jgi:hypothetical protein
MYLEGKYHIGKELRGMLGMKRVSKLYGQAGKYPYRILMLFLPLTNKQKKRTAYASTTCLKLRLSD